MDLTWTMMDDENTMTDDDNLEKYYREIDRTKKKLDKEEKMLIKKFLFLKSCMCFLDDNEYIETEVLCNQLRIVASKLSNWEAYKIAKLNDINRNDYASFLNNYPR